MPHLRIVAVSDVYTLENLPRLATLVRDARDGCDRLIVAVPGDFLGPSVLSSLDNGRGMVACLNAIGVTHVTFGNHEDDVPHRALLARMTELRATWLASNVHLRERQSRSRWLGVALRGSLIGSAAASTCPIGRPSRRA